jgi:fumarylacetoacetase
VTAEASKVQMHMPATIGEYTDFYSSKNHAYNMGCMLRDPKTALQPNWSWLPVGYHGRRSSIVVSGTDVRRPWGQAKPPTAEVPTFTQCKRMDFEMEIGAFLGGPANKIGEPVKVE